MPEEIVGRDWERKIAEEYNRTGDYREMYRQYGKLADIVWDSKSRPDYQTDLWYNLNRNEICLNLIGKRFQDKSVLSVGGGFWLEYEFLKQLGAKNTTVTDIIGNKELGTIEADVENLPFDDEVFDAVVCRDVIEHVLDEQKAYSEMGRVLKDDGYLLVTTPNAYASMIDGTVHRRAYSPMSLLEEMTMQGFRLVGKAGNVPYIFTSLFELAVMGIPRALQDFKYIDSLTKKYSGRYYIGTQLFVLCQKGVL